MYKGYTDDNYAFEGYTEKANSGRDYNGDDYVYARWRLGLDRSLILF